MAPSQEHDWACCFVSNLRGVVWIETVLLSTFVLYQPPSVVDEDAVC